MLLTVSTLHNVHSFVFAVVGSGRAGHNARRVAHQHNLSAAGVQLGVGHAAQLERREAGAVDDDISALAAVVERSRFRDVLHDAPTDLCAILAALPDEPGQVERCVDADGREGGGRVDAVGELVLGDKMELRGESARAREGASGDHGKWKGLQGGFAVWSGQQGVIYIRHHVLPPRLGLQQFREPVAGCCPNVFCAVVQDGLLEMNVRLRHVRG